MIIMKVLYENYEKEKGFEEIQANIYNENMIKYKGRLSSIKQIKMRYNDSEFDHRGVQYAFNENHEPLAYIQTRRFKNWNRTYIGYPWFIDNCPKEIQEKLFSDMLNYIRQRDPNKVIVLGNVQPNWVEVHDFAKQFQGTKYEESKAHVLSISKTSQIPNDGYSWKLATPCEENRIIDLVKTDPSYNFLPNDEARRDHFKERFSMDRIILIYKNDQLVSAGALDSLKSEDSDRFVKYTINRENKFEYWRAFVIEQSKYLCSIALKSGTFSVYDKEPNQLKFYEDNEERVNIETL